MSIRKSTIAAAVAIAAAGLAQTPATEARGLRIGFGIGGPSGHLSPIADPTILQNAERAKHRVNRQERAVIYGDRHHLQAAAAARVRQEKAAAAREAQRQAAAQAAESRRQAAAAQAAAAQAAETRRRETAAARNRKTIEISRQATGPSIAAIPPAAQPAGDRELELAQEQQRAKAEALLKSLSSPAHKPTPVPVAAPVATPAPTPAPVEVVAPKSAAEPPPVVVVPIGAPSEKARPAPAGECRRFIPAAGITVKVPCSE